MIDCTLKNACLTGAPASVIDDVRVADSADVALARCSARGLHVSGTLLVGLLVLLLVVLIGCGESTPPTASQLIEASLVRLEHDIDQHRTVILHDRMSYAVGSAEARGAMKAVSDLALQAPAKGRMLAEVTLTGCFSATGQRAEATVTTITLDGGVTCYGRLPGQPWELGEDAFFVMQYYERYRPILEHADDCVFVEDPALQRPGCRLIRCRPDIDFLMPQLAAEAFVGGFTEDELAEHGIASALIWVRLADDRLERVKMELRIERPDSGSWIHRFDSEMTGWGESIDPPIEAPAL